MRSNLKTIIGKEEWEGIKPLWGSCQRQNIILLCTADQISIDQSETLLGRSPTWPQPFLNIWQVPGKSWWAHGHHVGDLWCKVKYAISNMIHSNSSGVGNNGKTDQTVSSGWFLCFHCMCLPPCGLETFLDNKTTSNLWSSRRLNSGDLEKHQGILN